eukprot:777071-Pyramimonas_sp.AAC.1
MLEAVGREATGARVLGIVRVEQGLARCHERRLAALGLHHAQEVRHVGARRADVRVQCEREGRLLRQG